jgi:hypothetical protein
MQEALLVSLPSANIPIEIVLSIRFLSGSLRSVGRTAGVGLGWQLC